MAQFHVGISGWTYGPWRGVFYPQGLPQKRELAYCCGCFSSLEINGSFYSLQRPDSYRTWYAQAPAGFVFADTAGRWPYAEDVTADFVYVRLHGAEELYASGYTDAQLDWWADRCRAWAAGAEPVDARRVVGGRPPARPRDVFVYFDNDAKVHAPFDAIRLAQRLCPGSGRHAAVVP
jgi:uncharacterized protein YecE (DUF72 family)